MSRRGGHRPGAGRPKGSKDKAPRAPSAPPAEPEAQKAFLEACADFVKSGEPFRILREFLDSPDASRRAWAVDKLLLYGVGAPGKRAEVVDDRPDLGKIIAEAARRAREHLENAPERPPASQPLISAGSPERDPEPPRAALPPEPIASPGPSRPGAWPRYEELGRVVTFKPEPSK